MAAAIIREALNATTMSLTLYCQGQSRVGINLAGTWAGTVSFFFSTDGVTFAPNPLTVRPFASGTTVQSATANGNWEADVQNYVAVRAVFTRTSGTVIVSMGASIDASYQEVFLAASSVFVAQSHAAGAANVVTIAAQANRGWRLRTLTVGWSAAPAAAVLCTIADSATTIWETYVPVTVTGNVIALPAERAGLIGMVSGGVYNTPGNSLVITVGDPGGSVVSKINAEIIPF